MAPPILDKLLDSDPNLPTVPESHDQLTRDAKTPASVLDLRESVRVHAETCSTARVVRRWTKIACILAGAVLVVQIYREAIVKEQVRQIVREALREELHRAPLVEHVTGASLVPMAHAQAASKAHE